MPSRIQTYSKLAENTAVEITRTPQQWTAFLRTAAQVYKYSYNDQLMIFAQRPDATACASYDIWLQKMGRYVKRGASGIALLDVSGDYPKIKYVFDVADTGTSEKSRTPNLWEYKPEHEKIVREALYQNHAVGGITFADQLEETVKFEVDDYWYAHKSDILRNIDGSMLQEYNEDSIRMSFVEAASASAGYVLLTRCGIDTTERYRDVDFIQVMDFNVPGAVFSLGSAVSICSESILREIEVVVKRYEREKRSERSNDHERTDLQNQRGLPDSQSGAVRPVPAAFEQVRQDAEGISAGEQAGAVVQPDPVREVVSPPAGNRRNSESEAGNHYDPDAAVSRRDGTDEAGESHEVGRDDEHDKTAGGRSDPEGTGLRIDLSPETQVSFFPSELQQIEYLEQAERVEITPSAFAFPQEVIDQVLRIGGNTDQHRMAIAAEFSKGKGLYSNAAFLKEIYHGGNGITQNGISVTAWFADAEIRLSSSHSARHARTYQAITWESAAQRIEQLLEDGQFATKVEVAEAPGYERKILAEKLWYLTSDLSEEGIRQDLLPTIRNLHGGFPAETALLSGFLGDTASIRALTNELETFQQSYSENRSVLRFHYHHPELLLAATKELTAERKIYHSNLIEIPASEQHITDDEIESSFMRGSGIAGGKDRIYEYFSGGHTTHEQAEFLKREYGTGGRSHALSGSSGSSEDHDSKGITLRKDGCEKVFLTWEKAAKRIAEMIRQDHYFSYEEAQKYRAIQEAREPEPEPVAEEPEHDEWEDIDTEAIKARLKEHGIVNGEVVDREALDNSPFIRMVMADAERIAAEDRISEEMDQLAEEVDSLAYDFDTYEYNDRVSNRYQEVSRLQSEIHSGRTGAIQNFLTSVLAGTDAGYAERAYTLLTQLNELVPEPAAMYAAYPNQFSHNALDRMNIQEIKPDGSPGETLGSCRAEKSDLYISALNSGKKSPQEVRSELTAEAEKWHCYIIPDLVSWNPVVAGDRPRTDIEFYDTYEEARQRFMELRSQSYNSEEMRNPETNEPLARLTFGIQREFPPSAADLIHVRNGMNYAVDDFTRMSALNGSEEVMGLLRKMQQDLGFDRIRIYEKDDEGIYLPPKDIAFSDWENPYFDSLSEERLFLVNNQTLLHVQTTDSGFDYTLYDRNSGQDIDGGVLENSGISIASAVREICGMCNLSYESVQEQDLSELDSLMSKPLSEMNVLEMVDYFMGQGMSEEQANELANSEWQARHMPKEEPPQLSQEYQAIVDAMAAGGFTYSENSDGNTVQFTDNSGYPLTFNGWPEALQWIETAEFKDNPELRTTVQTILHSDREYAKQNLIPGVTEFVWDDRRFQVDSVDLDNDKVELRDITFQNSTGFPILRVEHIGKVREHLEQQMPIVEAEIVNAEPAAAPVENFRIIDSHLGEGGPKSKFADNLQAIQLLKQLEAEGRQAAPDEQEVLSRYVGWGGIPEAFDPNKEAWKSEYDKLKEILTPEEYQSAAGSTLNAHYTSPVVIQAIYSGLQQMGFQSGKILEPAMGVGNFFGMLPESMRTSRLYGVELDSISGRIARQLYPDADITIAGFETTNRKNSFDLVVGNVPFGNYSVNDRDYNSMNLSIHNYFVVKALDQVRPGGITAVVTSRYTLDAKNSAARRYMAERADLLGAIRLPNTAFKSNACAEVVSDILFFQKREQPMEVEPSWVQTEPKPQGHPINHYFIENPEMVLGCQTETSTAHGMDYTVNPLDTPLDQLLQQAVSQIKGTYREAVPSLQEDELEPSKTIPADPAVKNFSYAVIEDRIYYRENSIMQQVDVSAAIGSRIKGMVAVRNVLSELMTYEVQDYPEAAIQEKQQELNTVYDAFTEKYGLINSKQNEKAFRDDPSFYLLSALEYVDENGNLERKADVFYKRTIRASHPIERADSPNDALGASIGEKGRVDLAYMSGLLDGMEESQITEALTGVIFQDPSLPEGEQWVTADEYLSGPVREKLRIAEEAVQSDPKLSVNVESLKQAQPKPLDASEIDVRLGATWVDPEYVQNFMFEVFQTPYYRRYKTRVEYSAVTGEWRVGDKGVGWNNDVAATSTYGTTRMTAYQILEDTLNLRDARVNDYVEIDGKKKAVLNQRETTLACQKQQAINDAFVDWVWKDPQRRNDLVAKYNELFNATRPREYDGSHIIFPGMNPEITLRQHQLNAVAHVLYGHNVLLGHEVGAGKTYEMIASAMESKRLGQCQKSLIVVPNHLTLQWATDVLRLYPSAKVLVTRKQDFQPDNRKKFCSRIATGDFDIIVMGHSQFEMVPISAERQRQTIEEQLQEIEDAIYDERWSGKSFTVKQLQKTKKALEVRLEKLMATDRKDDVVTFEELGVDKLFVDEAQAYKNLFYHTKMRNIAGLANSESQRSTDMFMKCRYLDELTNGRGVVFATGTPISNSVSEMFTMMRYLQYDTLAQHHLSHFDAWAGTFGQTTTSIELAPEGTGYRARTRFAKFYNLPELMCMFSEAADIKTSDQLHLPVPEAVYETIAVKPTEQQKQLVESLSKRAAEIHAGNVDPSTDNMLKITSDGKKLGLDQRLINPMLPDAPDSKVNACVAKVYEIWSEGKAEKLTQMIFCDLSTPSGNGRKKEKVFCVYDDIKEKLIAKGVPSDEIAFIHDASSENDKKDLFTKVRAGQVRVLLGSTSKVGAGTNVQDRLVAVHHLDVPWRPADMVQRNGRIIRQGNQNSVVHIYQYVTQDTFDAYLFQTLEKKQQFISQIMTSKSPARSCEDVDESVLSYAEIKSLCAGNPLIKEKMDLDIAVATLKTLKSSYSSEHYRLEDKILTYYPREIQNCEQFISACQKDLAVSEMTSRDEFNGMTVSGNTYTEKKEAGQAVIDACKRMERTETVKIGTYRGFSLEISFNSFAQEYQAVLRGAATHTAFLSNDPNGNIVRLDNAISHIPERLESAGSKLTDLQEQLQAAKEELKKPFPKEQELRDKTARLVELNQQLDMNARDTDQEKAKEDIHEDAPSSIREQVALARRQAEESRSQQPTLPDRDIIQR